jgi:hypothetical protein
MKKPNGNREKSAATATKRTRGRNGVAARPPVWKTHLDGYPEKCALTFAAADELDRAIDLLWTEALRTMPHDTPDGKTLIVPAEAVDHFARAGLQFTAKPLRSLGELAPEERQRLRSLRKAN